MIDASDAVDPNDPPVTAQAVRHLLVIEQANAFIKAVKEHSKAVGGETERSLEAVGAISQICTSIRVSIEGHVKALEAHSEDQAETRALLLDLATAVRVIDSRLPDPKKVRHEILGDLWQTLEPRVLEYVAKIGGDLDARVGETATRLFEAAERGFMAPARPEQGAALATRLRYRRDRCIYRIKKWRRTGLR